MLEEIKSNDLNEEPDAETKGWQNLGKDEQIKYEIYKTEMEAKVRGAAMRENLERVLRDIFLRDTKARLKPLGSWTKWCIDTGLDVKQCQRDLDKIGEFRQDALLNFGSHVGYDLNKIKYLQLGDIDTLSRKTGVEAVIENNKFIIDDHEIDFTPDEVKLIIEARDEKLRRAEEKAEEEKKSLEKEHQEALRKLKKTIRVLEKFKKAADDEGISPEEKAFLEQMDAIKMRFTEAVQEFYKMALDTEDMTDPMKAACKATLEYMHLLLDGEG